MSARNTRWLVGLALTATAGPGSSAGAEIVWERNLPDGTHCTIQREIIPEVFVRAEYQHMVLDEKGGAAPGTPIQGPAVRCKSMRFTLHVAPAQEGTGASITITEHRFDCEDPIGLAAFANADMSPRFHDLARVDNRLVLLLSEWNSLFVCIYELDTDGSISQMKRATLWNPPPDREDFVFAFGRRADGTTDPLLVRWGSDSRGFDTLEIDFAKIAEPDYL